MKNITIGGLQFSKALCGTNAFYGRSHFSLARDAEYLGRFDEKNIIKSIECCMKWGINTVETSANEKITDIINSLKEKHQCTLHCIGSTRIDETSIMDSHHQKLDFLIHNRAAICVIHAQYIDDSIKNNEIPGLEQMLDKIREAGLITAISTHHVKTVELCENKGYPVDTYLFPLNLLGFVFPGYEGKETAEERVNLVRGISKPFMLMKTLAAGRIPPDEGLHFIAENSKPNDLISLGFGGEAEIDETMELFNKLFN